MAPGFTNLEIDRVEALNIERLELESARRKVYVRSSGLFFLSTRKEAIASTELALIKAREAQGREKTQAGETDAK